MIAGGLQSGLIALVPMRHHSERVTGKNYRRMAGKPLYAHILDTLLSCRAITQIAVDTDSPVIAEGIAGDYPQVVLIDRPLRLRGDEIPMNEILLHDASVIPSPFYLQTHSTNPLLRPDTVSRAIADFIESYPAHDALFSVTRLQKRLWDAAGRPVNHDPEILLRTQELAPLFEENSCLYIFEREAFLARRNRLASRPRMFEIPALEAFDIDEEADFSLVEALMARRVAADQKREAP